MTDIEGSLATRTSAANTPVLRPVDDDGYAARVDARAGGARALDGGRSARRTGAHGPPRLRPPGAGRRRSRRRASRALVAAADGRAHLRARPGSAARPRSRAAGAPDRVAQSDAP